MVNWFLTDKTPKGEPKVLFSNLGEETFVEENGVSRSSGRHLFIPNISPPKESREGYTFGAGLLIEAALVQMLVSKLNFKKRGKKKELSFMLPERAKDLYNLSEKLEQKEVLGVWYFDQAALEGGEKIFISGKLEPRSGPLCADYVRLAASGYQKSLKEMMIMAGLSGKIVEQFDKAFDLVCFWLFCHMWSDVVSGAYELAAGKAVEIGDLARMISDPRIKSIVEEVLDSTLEGSKYKKDWKELVL